MTSVAYDVPMVTQPDDLSCWAATIAMVASASLPDGDVYTAQQVIEFADQEGDGRFNGAVRWDDIGVASTRWGLEQLAPADWMPDGWADVLRERGPLGIVVLPAGAQDGAYHAVVLRAVQGDGTVEGTRIGINDPTPGSDPGADLDFTTFTQEWDLGAAANATILFDPAFTAPAPAPAPTQLPPPTQEQFQAALDGSSTETLADGPDPVTAEPVPGGIIAGEITDAVNAGVTLVHLVANHAGLTIDRTRVARALPASLQPEDLSDWQGPRRYSQRFSMPPSSSWEFWIPDYSFDVGVQFIYNGRREHAPGQYLDDVTVFLQVDRLPADFTIDAVANFPASCHMFGPREAPIAGMPFTIDVQVKGFLGQLLSWSKTLSVNVFGDGTASIS